MNLKFQDINDLMDVVGNRMDDLSDAGLAYTDDGDTDETKRLWKLYLKLKALSEESEERLPCGHPVTDDYAHNDPNPGATHFCVSCEKESEE